MRDHSVVREAQRKARTDLQESCGKRLQRELKLKVVRLTAALYGSCEALRIAQGLSSKELPAHKYPTSQPTEKQTKGYNGYDV